MPFSVREGINIFLSGFVPTENLRFREEELNFKLATSTGTILTFHYYYSVYYYLTLTYLYTIFSYNRTL